MTMAGSELNNLTFRNYSRMFEKGVDLALMECGYEKCDSLHFWEGKKGFHIIHFVLSGKGKLEIDGKTYALSAGHGFYIGADSHARYSADSQDPWEYRWIGFLGTYGVGALNATTLPRDHVFTTAHTAEYAEMLANIYAHAMTKTESAEYRALGQLYILLAKLMDEFGVQEKIRGAADEYLKGAVELIRKNYTVPFGVNDLCQRINITRSYLYKLFIHHYGVSPSEYLVKFRLEKAREIMDSGHSSVDSLAERTGFASQSYFTKRFRETYGMPPREYMRRADQEGKKK